MPKKKELGPQMVEKTMPDGTVLLVPRRGREKPASKTLKKHKEIIELATKGCTPTQIARAVPCSKETVYRVIDKFKEVFKRLEDVKDYQEHRQDLLSAAEFRLLEGVVDEKAIKKASLMTRAQAFKIVYEARRLDNNQSTANISVARFTSVKKPEGEES